MNVHAWPPIPTQTHTNLSFPVVPWRYLVNTLLLLRSPSSPLLPPFPSLLHYCSPSPSLLPELVFSLPLHVAGLLGLPQRMSYESTGREGGREEGGSGGNDLAGTCSYKHSACPTTKTLASQTSIIVLNYTVACILTVSMATSILSCSSTASLMAWEASGSLS